jgi:hypothetical protein
MAARDYESAIARAQQALVDELVAARTTIQDEREELLKQVADLDGLVREIDARLHSVTGSKKRVRVLGRGDQILAVLSGHGDPLSGDAILSTLTSDPAERGRYGLALKKLVSLGQVTQDSDGLYSFVAEP